MKVFVSSTFVDLRLHRKAVEEVLNRVQAQFQGMEYFGARPFEPKRACFSELRESSVFVGIYAHRYGHIPKGEATSITEQEFDFAQRLNLPCYCYVVDPDHPWPPAHMEDTTKEQRQIFLAKVSDLVRERFTTPDDLAKKVAADLYRQLRSSYIASTKADAIAIGLLSDHCKHEIDTTIGPKYLRQLYVARRLDGNLRRFPRATVRSLFGVRRYLRTFADLISRVDVRPFEERLDSANLTATNAESKKAAALASKRSAGDRYARAKERFDEASAQNDKARLATAELDMKAAVSEVQRIEAQIKTAEAEYSKAQSEAERARYIISTAQILASTASNQQQALEHLTSGGPKTPDLWYPARALLNGLQKTQETLRQRTDGLRALFPGMAKPSEALTSEIEKLKNAIKPVYLVVDRAGGGKTNLLCHMAEEIGKVTGCLFVAAKSIPEATEVGIVSYLASVYPFGNDPVKTLTQSLSEEELPLIIVVDGINENANPSSFNAAIKGFIRRYYGAPVRFVISCRDIYWEYFKDDWWNSHVSHLSTNSLYAFSGREFRQALPLYLDNYCIEAEPVGNARIQLTHPLLLRFYCEAFRGTTTSFSRMGRINDIRLLDLFEAYCDRKFRQIQQRLQLLRADEIFEYLRMIASMMLDGNARSLAVRKVAQQARAEFGETSIRTLESRYVQILDEDILLEEKPAGSATNLTVSFVYEEFMEFIIAKALWSEFSGSTISATSATKLAERLLAKEKEFISVLGVILYIGELLATSSKAEGLQFVDWLIVSHREDLACRIIERWPGLTLDNDVFERLIRMQTEGRTVRVKQSAWNSLSKLCESDWQFFFGYVTRMELTGFFRPMHVFSVIGRLGGGVTPEERIATLRWMMNTVGEGKYIPKEVPSADLRNTLVAVDRIIGIAKAAWTASQRREASKIKRKLKGISDLLARKPSPT